MKKTLALTLINFIIFHVCLAQTLPKDGSSLNYRIIGFKFDEQKPATEYILDIAMGYFQSEDSFQKNIVVSKSVKKNQVVAEVPFFGSIYTWRITYTRSSNKKADGMFHHFSTTMIPALDSANMRFRVINTATAYKAGYVFLDGTKAMYDMEGRPVWHLPDINGSSRDGTQLYDLKTTPFGTITFIVNNKAYEVNYNGEILWQVPDNGAVNGEHTEHYHHELTRLSNGHYMVLGTESVLWDYKPQEDSTLFYATNGRMKSDTGNRKAHFGTIIEYDEKGNVVWSWRSSKYFMQSDVKYFKPKVGRGIIDVHENAFFFDEKNKYIYVSFKNISRLLKVKYPGGEVMNAYGEIYKPGVPQTENGLFCSQHSCRLTDDGSLYLFNNNNCSGDSAMPTIIVMKEPPPGKDSLERIWEYTCTTEGISENPQIIRRPEMEKRMREKHPDRPDMIRPTMRPTSGGNVSELPDHSFFVSMNNEYSKVLIVTRQKKVMWSAVPEKWNKAENRWIILPEYRASFITDSKELEQLIWAKDNTGH